jgi:Protein of unknown function (DUF1168)
MFIVSFYLQEKLVIIPELAKKDKEYNAPTFVRNVMGSSAGAGSGEFHVYRHLRRKEYARQKHLKMQSETERLNEEYQQRLEDNDRKAQEKTDKKRAKRLKKKMKDKKGKKPKLTETPTEESEEIEESESGDEEKEDSTNASSDDKPPGSPVPTTENSHEEHQVNETEQAPSSQL